MKNVNSQPDLVGYWKFDEGSGNTVTDSSGNNNNGNIMNLGSGVIWDVGKFGNGLKFLGTNGSVNIPNSTTLDFNKTNNLTISFWLNIESENRQDIISSGWWWNSDGFNIEYSLSTGYLALRGVFGGINVSDSSYFYYKPYVGIWTHVVFNFESAISRLYINGIKVVEKNMGGSLYFNENKAVIIGGNHFFLNGSLDEVKIFLRSLSEQEIQEIDPIIHDNQTLELSYGTLSDTIIYGNLSYNERSYNISLRANPENSSRNVTICTNIFDVISMKDVFPEGPQNIPEISDWNVKIFKNSMDDTSNWEITPLDFCKDNQFLSSDYKVVAKIDPKIKVLADYNKLKSISNMSYGVQLSGSSSFGNDWLTGGPDQSLWNITKKPNFSTLRIFDLSMKMCEDWNSTAHQCNEWNWTTADMAINSIINLGMEPLMAFYINFYQPWETTQGVPGMDIHWNNTSYPNPDDFANYIYEIVKHYNVNPYHYNIKYWEVINEPPVYGATQENLTAFVKLYNKSREKIKAVDASALTGVNYINSKPFFDFLVNYSDDIDFGTIHPYEGSSGRNNATLCLKNVNCSPPNDQYSYYTDSTLLNRASSFYALSSYGGLEQLRNIWREKRGKDLETFNSESDINSCGPYLCDPRQNNIMAAVWYTTKSKTMILDGSTLSIYFQLGSYNSNGNIYGGFGHALVKNSYPYEQFPSYWSNYLLANYIPKGSIIYDSTSNDSSMVDSLSVKTTDSNNILLINKMNISTDIQIPILGFGIKNATLHVLDQDSYKWYYNKTINKTIITYSNISTINLPKNNVQNITLNGYSVAILEVFSDSTAPYITNITNVDLESVTLDQNNYSIKSDAPSGTMSTIKVYWPYSIEPIITYSGGLFHSYDYDNMTHIVTLNATHSSPVTWNLQAQSSSDLIGYWNFDEGLGTTANDFSPFHNDGTLFNGPTWVNGKFGKALQFDGVNDYVNITDSDSLDATDGLTIGVWINLSSWSSSYPRIVSKEISTTANPYALELNNANKSVMFCIDNGSGESCVDSGQNTISLNNWYHVAGTWNSTHSKIYINGQLKTTLSLSGSMTATSNNVLIGNNPSKNRQFNGTIDEVKIWDRALNDSEINDQYEMEVTKSYTVSINGSNVIATNDQTGIVEFNETNTSLVVQSVLDKLTTGGVIYFKKGMYNSTHHWQINNTNIILTGEEGTVVDFLAIMPLNQNEAISGILVLADNATVEGFTIKNCEKAGIKARNVNYVTFRNNQVINTWTGIIFESVSNSVIDSNNVTLTQGDGIYITGDYRTNITSKNITVNNNSIYNVGDTGIDVSNGRDNITFNFIYVSNNYIEGYNTASRSSSPNGLGLTINTKVSNFTVQGNTVNNMNLSFNANGYNGTISQNTLTNFQRGDGAWAYAGPSNANVIFEYNDVYSPSGVWGVNTNKIWIIRNNRLTVKCLDGDSAINAPNSVKQNNIAYSSCQVDTERPRWSNFYHIPAEPAIITTLDSVTINVTWYDNQTLQTVMIWENSTGSWQGHIV